MDYFSDSVFCFHFTDVKDGIVRNLNTATANSEGYFHSDNKQLKKNAETNKYCMAKCHRIFDQLFLLKTKTFPKLFESIHRAQIKCFKQKVGSPKDLKN